MMAERRGLIIGAVAGCVVGVCMTAWVLGRSTPASLDRQAETPALHVDVSSLTVRAAAQPATSADTSAESAAPQFEEATVKQSVSPSRRTAVTWERPLPEPPPGDTATLQHQGAVERAQALSDDRVTAELKTRAAGYLQRLDGIDRGPGSPLGRVSRLFAFLEQGYCAGGACQAVQRVTEDYVYARAALLRRLLVAFLESDGAYDGAREHAELATLQATFQATLTEVAGRVPMLAMLPAILETTLRVPDYLEAPPDDTGR